jgi:hypothetical protein
MVAAYCYAPRSVVYAATNMLTPRNDTARVGFQTCGLMLPVFYRVKTLNTSLPFIYQVAQTCKPFGM